MKKTIIFSIICFFVISSVIISAEQSSENNNEIEFTKQRIEMIKYQIKARGIKDSLVLTAISHVKRHLFVPDSLKRYAYSDHPLPIDAEQTISQPYIVAIMTELLELNGNENVLEIGTGSGYQAAILGEIAKEVYSIEIIEQLAEQAKDILNTLGYENITVKSGDGYIGWKEHAPFDGIIVTCAPPYIPEPLIEQLAEGGRMVIPVGINRQELLLIKKVDGKIIKENIIPVRFVPMTGEAEK